jgi:hypothetical protein
MMGLYNFQPRFVPFIKSGNKTHTIRAMRKHPDEPGNQMYLYTGLRTKKAKLLIEATCVKTEIIEITETQAVKIDGYVLDDYEKDLLAKRDGFENFVEMMKFWDGRLPFLGQIIHWRCETNGSKQNSAKKRAAN